MWITREQRDDGRHLHLWVAPGAWLTLLGLSLDLTVAIAWAIVDHTILNPITGVFAGAASYYARRLAVDTKRMRQIAMSRVA